MHDASVFQALYGIDQIHGHNKKNVQVENDLFVFQIFVQWRAFREFVTQQAAIIENNINMYFDDIESLKDTSLRAIFASDMFSEAER